MQNRCNRASALHKGGLSQSWETIGDRPWPNRERIQGMIHHNSGQDTFPSHKLSEPGALEQPEAAVPEWVNKWRQAECLFQQFIIKQSSLFLKWLQGIQHIRLVVRTYFERDVSTRKHCYRICSFRLNCMLSADYTCAGHQAQYPKCFTALHGPYSI